MNFKRLIIFMIPVLLLTACKDTKSYSELLNDEEKAVNSFLAHQKVINEIPADTVFETGSDAPYYKIDEDGDIYMQVIKPGDRKITRFISGLAESICSAMNSAMTIRQAGTTMIWQPAAHLSASTKKKQATRSNSVTDYKFL